MPLLSLLVAAGCQHARPLLRPVQSSTLSMARNQSKSDVQEPLQGDADEKRRTLYLGETSYAPPEAVSSKENWILTGFWVPYMKVRADRDDKELAQGLEFHADLDRGRGWGARLGGEGKDGGGGVLYVTTLHDEKRIGAHARTHSAYLEAYFGTKIPVTDGLSLFGGFGVGFGGAVFDFTHTFNDTGGAAIEGRVVAGFLLFRRIRVEGGGAWFLWGYPGETIGTGSFATLGGSIAI